MKSSHRRHDIDTLANWNAIFSGIALYPQAYKVFVTNSVEDLAYSTFLIILLNSLVWLGYGLHRKLPPLIVSSALNALAAGYIVAMF